MRIAVVSLVLSFLCTLSFSQSHGPELHKGYYAVVGTFAIQKNAITLNSKLKKQGWNTAYGFLPSQRVYYVYTLVTDDLNTCLQEAKRLRELPEFNDAWTRRIDEGGDEVALAVEKPVEPVKTSIVETTPLVETSEPQENPEVKIPLVATLENSEVFLSLYNEANDRVVEGKVQVIDTDRARLITEVKGNSYLALPDPKNKTGRLTLICDAVGYRKVQHDLIYSKPLTDSTRQFIDEMGSSLTINFSLTQYHLGDIRTLYNVYFYNDAAVFLPESKFELTQLLEMMKGNQSYRIKLHGHTNGNHHGKIIKVGPSGNFFSVSQDGITTSGSAKELSESRAEVIKKYLVANGIDESRVEVKAWGGKRPLYDKNSANAKKNIRVEVEVITE